MFQITINEHEISSEEGKTVLDAALENGIYIPHLCFFSGLGASKSLLPDHAVYRGEKEIINDQDGEYEGCNLCLIEVEGRQGLCHACATPVERGIRVFTETAEIKERRKEHLGKIFENHPNFCLTCELAQGCNRKLCSMNIPEKERCCWKFGNCELQGVAAYVGFEGGITYTSKNFPLLDDNPLFTRDYNLCINCLRCVVACREAAKKEVVGFVYHEGTPLVGIKAPTLKGSGCIFCLACVDVCPTGALREKKRKKKKSNKIRLGIASPVFPPEKEELIVLNEETLMKLPETEGVYRLFDNDKTLIQITGTENLKLDLREELNNITETIYFNFEEDEMFTTRERQLIQQYLKKHGKMPTGNDEFDELF